VTTDMVKLDDGILLVGKAKHDDTKNAFYMLERDANVDYYGLRLERLLRVGSIQENLIWNPLYKIS
jgi:hypothetical protein